MGIDRAGECAGPWLILRRGDMAGDGSGLWIAANGYTGRFRAFTARRWAAVQAGYRGLQGQAAAWYADVLDDCSVRLPGLLVAKELARLCGDDSRVKISWRSLADDVGRKDKGGRRVAFTEGGVKTLVSSGWLKVESTGVGNRKSTTFFLMPADERDVLRLSAATVQSMGPDLATVA